MTTYTYEITNLVTGADDLVVTASFSITAKDGPDEFTHTYTTGFAPPQGTPIPFADLTESQVIDWIIAAAGGDNQFEAAADAELAAFKQRKAAPLTSQRPVWTASRTPRQPSPRGGRPE